MSVSRKCLLAFTCFYPLTHAFQNDVCTDASFCNISSSQQRPYAIKPITKHFGAVIENFNITKQHVEDQLFMQNLQADIHKYLLVVFKNQELPDNLQVDLSSTFGEAEPGAKGPHPKIMR